MVLTLAVRVGCLMLRSAVIFPYWNIKTIRHIFTDVLRYLLLRKSYIRAKLILAI